MIMAFCRSGRILSDDKHIRAARTAMDRILKDMVDADGGVLHACKEDGQGVQGFLDDHSFLIGALLDVYETTLRKNILGRR